MFSHAIIERDKATIQNLIDQAVNTGLIALAGGSIAGVLAIGAPMCPGDTQAAMPTLEWRSPLDQRAVRALCPEPCVQRLVSTVGAPVGQGWG
jgi:hypothetical protein